MSLPFNQMLFAHTKWFNPIYSTNKSSGFTPNTSVNVIFICIGTLHNPKHFTFEYLFIASVTIPDGFVKLISQAFGQTSSISLHISRITGIVLKAFAKPPGPQVSCPITLYFKGNLSSLALASNPPTLN